jgi:hypothetical protein
LKQSKAIRVRARPHCVKGHRITSGNAGVVPTAPDGIYVARVLHGGTEDDLLALLKRRFAEARHFKPPANRKDSAEMLVVATGFSVEGDRRNFLAFTPKQ